MTVATPSARACAVAGATAPWAPLTIPRRALLPRDDSHDILPAPWCPVTRSSAG